MRAAVLLGLAIKLAGGAFALALPGRGLTAAGARVVGRVDGPGISDSGSSGSETGLFLIRLRSVAKDPIKGYNIEQKIFFSKPVV